MGAWKTQLTLLGGFNNSTRDIWDNDIHDFNPGMFTRGSCCQEWGHPRPGCQMSITPQGMVIVCRGYWNTSIRATNTSCTQIKSRKSKERRKGKWVWWPDFPSGKRAHSLQQSVFRQGVAWIISQCSLVLGCLWWGRGREPNGVSTLLTCALMTLDEPLVCGTAERIWVREENVSEAERKKNVKPRDVSGGPVVKTSLPLQGVWCCSLVRELWCPMSYNQKPQTEAIL